MQSLAQHQKAPKVLVVDNAWHVRCTIEDLLAAEGYDVGSAEDGVAAVEAFGREKPDLVLMDLLMPRKDGIEACMEIRRMDEDARILFMTGLGHQATAREVADAGGMGIVPKPVAAGKLRRAIATALGNGDGEGND